ncbi:MAG TPA: class I SAM-dependent methyltransferase [Terriglobia bacterium]|nr:class I SAM-dependent methyltransferase [Terriglobia bacterium]
MSATLGHYPAKQRYWGAVARDYNRWRLSSPLRRYIWEREFRVLERIAREQLCPHSTILDAPTGTGRIVPLFRSLGHKVTGVDISLDMLRMQFSQLGNLSCGLVRGDCEVLPFADGAFDYVISLRFMGHVPPEVRSRVLQEFKRVARKGLIVAFPVVQSITKLKFKLGNLRYRLVNGKPRCWWPATPSSLPSELNTAGLRVANELKLLGPFSQIVFLHLTAVEPRHASAHAFGHPAHMASV